MARLKNRFESIAQGEMRLGFDPLGGDEARLANIRIDQIETDPDQPRKEIGDLDDLKASIKEHGILQPIIVSPINAGVGDTVGADEAGALQLQDRFRLISGERRYTAARDLKLGTVPAIVRTVEEHHRLEVQLIENLHRKDLTPIEEATGYQRLMSEFGLSQRQLAKRIGRSPAAINQMLRVLSLPDEILLGVQTSEHPAALSRSALLEIAKLPTEKEQLDLWRRVEKSGLTVREARQEKSKSGSVEPKQEKPRPYRASFQVHRAVVTVVFDRPEATREEVAEALEQALGHVKTPAVFTG